MKKNGIKSNSSGKRIALIVLCVVLALILVSLLLATVYIERMLGLINRVGTEATTAPTQVIDATGSTVSSNPLTPLSSEPAEIIQSGGTVNILLLGTDLSEDRSDTVILCTLNKSNNTLTLTSFMRDTYVDIPGFFPHKLNTAYGLGDGRFRTMDETLKANFGVQLDGNVAINFENFIKVIDLIGGIDIELTEDEASYMMTTPWNGLDSSGWSLHAGTQTLNGDQALAYSRIRDVNDKENHPGDFGRTNRQRLVLGMMLDKIRDMGLLQINDLLTEILPMITTDLSNAEILQYAVDLLPVLQGSTVVSQQIPADGTYYLDWVEQDGGMSIIRISDWEANRDILENTLTGK